MALKYTTSALCPPSSLSYLSVPFDFRLRSTVQKVVRHFASSQYNPPYRRLLSTVCRSLVKQREQVNQSQRFN